MPHERQQLEGSHTGSHHEHMASEFRHCFWVSLVSSIPVVTLSPTIQELPGVRQCWPFAGDSFVQLGISSAAILYGGWPFLRALVEELRAKGPAMMTPIAAAITVAYAYSAVVVLGIPERVFLWVLTGAARPAEKREGDHENPHVAPRVPTPVPA